MRKFIIACCLTLAIPLQPAFADSSSHDWEQQNFIDRTVGALKQDASRMSRIPVSGTFGIDLGYNQGNRAPDMFRTNNPTIDRMHRIPTVIGGKMGWRF